MLAARHRLPFRGLIQFSSALILLWVSFYVMGQALMLIPSTYHDSQETFWEQLQTIDREDDTASEGEDEAASEILRTGGQSL